MRHIIKKEFGHEVQIGEKYEFCKIVNNISTVFYGTIIEVNGDTKTATFKCKNGDIHENINAIRGIAFEKYVTQPRKEE